MVVAVSEHARGAARPLVAIAVLLTGCAVESEPEDRLGETALQAKKPKPGSGGEEAAEEPCSSSKGARAYAKGYAKGHKTVDKAWDKRVDDCDRLEPFLERALLQIEKVQGKLDRGGGREQRLCRLVGQMDGAVDALDAVSLACGDACAMHGVVVGEISAITYCELALQGAGLDVDAWVRGRVNLCGVSYEIGCDGAFIGTTGDYMSEAGSCVDFTVGPYHAPWERTRTKACDYAERPDGDGRLTARP